MEKIYPLLRKLAAQRLRRNTSITWQPTDLVGEAYSKIFKEQRGDFRNRAHFAAIAARVMRRVVADHHRERQTQKRGDGACLVSLDEALGAGEEPARAYVDLIEMDAALDELAQIDARSAQVVELRYFAGLSVPEVGSVMDLSERTVKRSWQFARAWLHHRLQPQA